LLVAVAAPPVLTEREFAEYAPPRLHAGVTASAPSAVAASLHAGVTVIEPTVYPENVQEGVTVSVPTVAAEKVQMFVQAACRPIRKVVAVGVPHTKAPTDANSAAVVIPVQPPIVSDAVPATNVSGAPTVRAPTAAVKTPVPILIAVTATGAAWVVT